MAIGSGNLPHDGMQFTPFDPLPAGSLNDMVENIEAVASGTGIGDGAVTASKINPTPQDTDPNGAFYDSGWVTLTLQNGFSAGGGQIPQCRRIGNVVYLRGSVVHASTTSTFTSCAILPVGFRPTEQIQFPVTSNSPATFVGRIEPDGTIPMWAYSATAAFRPLIGGSGFTVD